MLSPSLARVGVLVISILRWGLLLLGISVLLGGVSFSSSLDYSIMSYLASTLGIRRRAL
jgi:hypothetical protein